MKTQILSRHIIYVCALLIEIVFRNITCTRPDGMNFPFFLRFLSSVIRNRRNDSMIRLNKTEAIISRQAPMMLIFWPYCELESGIIFGWQCSEICVVVGSFPFGSVSPLTAIMTKFDSTSAQYADAQSALKNFVYATEESYPKDHPFLSLAILGECICPVRQKLPSIPKVSFYGSATGVAPV